MGMVPEGVSHEVVHEDPGLDERGGCRKRVQGSSDASINLLPPSIMTDLAAADGGSDKRPQLVDSKTTGSDAGGSSSLCHRPRRSNAIEECGGGVLEPASPAVSTGSIPPLVAIDGMSLNPVDSVGEYHEKGRKGKVPAPRQPATDCAHQKTTGKEAGDSAGVDLVAVHEELSQLRQSLDKVASISSKEVDHHQTSQLIEHARSVMAALTRGAKYDPSVVPPELLTTPCQEAGLTDRRDVNALRTSPARMGSMENLKAAVPRDGQGAALRDDGHKSPNDRESSGGLWQELARSGT